MGMGGVRSVWWGQMGSHVHLRRRVAQCEAHEGAYQGCEPASWLLRWKRPWQRAMYVYIVASMDHLTGGLTQTRTLTRT